MNPYYDSIHFLTLAKRMAKWARNSLERRRGPDELADMAVIDAFFACYRSVVAVLGAVRDDTHNKMAAINRFSEVVSGSEHFPDNLIKVVFRLYEERRLAEYYLGDWIRSEPDCELAVEDAERFVQATEAWLEDYWTDETEQKEQAAPLLEKAISAAENSPW